MIDPELERQIDALREKQYAELRALIQKRKPKHLTPAMRKRLIIKHSKQFTRLCERYGKAKTQVITQKNG